MNNRIAAIPLYMSYSDVIRLYDVLDNLINNHDFCSDSTLVLSQNAMSMDIYVSTYYDGIHLASSVELN